MSAKSLSKSMLGFPLIDGNARYIKLKRQITEALHSHLEMSGDGQLTQSCDG